MATLAADIAHDSLAHYRLVGIDAPSLSRVVERVEHGLPFSAVERMQELIGAPSLREVGALLRMPERTVYYRKQKGRLSPEESDRLLRLARVVGLAIDLFEGNTNGAVRWLSTPKPQLEGASPLNYTKTAVGARAVEELIWRAEHSIYS
ncbi:MAG: type II RES/Xre toxin-antitoxin system antitoxin [Thermoanaerobaculia bacterium]